VSDDINEMREIDSGLPSIADRPRPSKIAERASGLLIA
jgi:hypothetical protein